MLSKRTSKNQLTIPKSVIKAFPGVEYFDVEQRGEEIVLRPVLVRSKTKELETIRGKMAKLGITEGDIEKAVAWARKRA